MVSLSIIELIALLLQNMEGNGVHSLGPLNLAFTSKNFHFYNH